MVVSENNSKQAQLIATAKKLFMKYGLRRVTVAEICEEAGVSKMTFYKYYSNKADIAKAFLLEQYEKGRDEYRNTMQQDLPFSKKVEQLIQQKLKNTEGISKEFMKDIYNDNRLGLQEFIIKKGKELEKEILDDFKKAAKKGEIRKGIKPEFIIYFLNRIRSMTYDEHLMNMYKKEQDLIMELTKFFFYGLGIKDETK